VDEFVEVDDLQGVEGLDPEVVADDPAEDGGEDSRAQSAVPGGEHDRHGEDDQGAVPFEPLIDGGIEQRGDDDGKCGDGVANEEVGTTEEECEARVHVAGRVVRRLNQPRRISDFGELSRVASSVEPRDAAKADAKVISVALRRFSSGPE
jgi:hypothetical protein